MTFRLVPWSELGRDDLYALLALRQRVFVVEQACAYLDADGLDRHALHLLGEQDGVLVACARLLPPGVAHVDAAIGRVVTAPEVRRTGLGRALMHEAIAACDVRGWRPQHLGAQAYLQRFYEALGFVVDGAPYDEDGIPHLPMRRS